jgi:hypothetical protein
VFANDGKDVIGAVVLLLLADPIKRIMTGAQIGNDRIAFLVDEDGVIVMHPYDRSSIRAWRPEEGDADHADQRFRRRRSTP